MNFRNALITLCLGSAACGASALSLGQARGVVVLGRPVDLAFDVHVDPGQSLEDACVRADLVSGSTPVASGRVRVMPLPTLPGRAPAVRVLSSLLADEPVLTVTLHVGCSGRTSRTYTFLADPPDTVAASRPVAIPAAAPVVPTETGTPSTTPTPSAAPASSAPAVRRPAVAVPALAPDEAAAPRRRPERAKAPKPTDSVTASAPAPAPKPEMPVARKGGKRADAARQKDIAPSRLVMEPLENWLESPSQLRMTPELTLPASSATEQQRAQALAEWQALNMRPEDLLKEGARMSTLSTELAQVRAQADKDRAATLQLLERLEKEKSERYSGTIVYLLLGLLVAVAAGAAWMATRLRAVTLQAQEAWAGAVARQSSAGAGDDDDWQPSVREDTVAPPLRAPETGPATVAPLPEPPAPPPAPQVSAPAPVPVPLPPEPVPPPPSAALLQAAQPALLINPEELFDLQQQAEFFVSVGEHSQAIGVLKKYIADNEATAPAAYLELLRLYRSLSRVDDFNQLRAQFHEHFNAQVPEFAAFNRPGRSLLSSPDVLAEIEALWSDESVVPLLDSLLFRGPETAVERFDLAAYDDLLLLNAIARITPPSARGAPPPRQRTTPLVSEEEAPPAVSAPVAQAAGRVPGEPVDLLGNGDNLLDAGGSMLDYDPDWLLEAPKGQAGPKPAPVSPAVADEPGLGFPLDFDLSDPFADEPVPLPPITQSDLPPVPPSQGPAPGQVVGFGANSDRFEARHDPEARKPN